jgi:prophage regulatory protein
MSQIILRLPDVLKRTGYSRSGLYHKIDQGTFPAPISLGERAVGWFEEEVDEWQKKCIAITEQSKRGRKKKFAE